MVALSLGPLPEEVVACILLSLPLLQRCRCEGVCKGWLAFLRAPRHHASLDTRAVTTALRLEGRCLKLSQEAAKEGEEESESDDEDKPLTTASALAALAARAGGSLRSLTVSGDGHVLALLPALTSAHAALASLRVRNASADALALALRSLARGVLPAVCAAQRISVLPASCAAQRISLGGSALASTVPALPDGTIADGDDSVACALLRTRDFQQSTCAAAWTLSFCLDDRFLAPDEDDDDWADDPRIVRCLRLGRLLALSSWRRVSISLPPSVSESEGYDSATLAILLETLLIGLAGGAGGGGGGGAAAQPAEAAASVVLDARCSVPLSVRDAVRVAAAVPPHARLLLDHVSCAAADVGDLPRALRAGRVAAATLHLDVNEEPVDAAAMARALAALAAVVDAAAADAAADADTDDIRGGFGLHVPGEVDAAACALVCAWLRERPRALRSVCLRVRDEAALAALVAALAGSSVLKLMLTGTGLSDASLAACVAPMLAANQLPQLIELSIYGSNQDGSDIPYPGVAFTQAMALALRARTTRLLLQFNEAPTADSALAALQPLIALAHPASGVPARAACNLALYLPETVDDGGLDGRFAEAVVALAAPLFAALAQPSADEHDSDDDDSRWQHEGDSEREPGKLAALLLHADGHGDMRAALRPTGRVLLLASFVRRARWPAALTDTLRFTSLLHRALLHWAHTGRDADATPHALGEVAAACKHALPPAGVHSLRYSAARFAACTALLACGLAGAAGCAGDCSQLEATSAWLTQNALWVMQTLASLLLAAGGAIHTAGVNPLLGPYSAQFRLQARAPSLLDAALHLSAAMHVPALRLALWDLPNFPAFLMIVLRAIAKPAPEDSTAAAAAADASHDVAAATICAAVHRLLAAAAPAQWAVLLTTWAVDKESTLFEEAKAVLAALAADGAPAAAAPLPQPSSSDRLAVAGAHAAAHAAAALAALQRGAALPARIISAQDMVAVAAVLRTMRLEEICQATDVRAAILHAGVLHWARDGPAHDATPALLVDILAACVRLLPIVAHLTPQAGRDALLEDHASHDAVLATVLLCGLLGDDASLPTVVEEAHAWLMAHKDCMLLLIASMPRASVEAAADASAAALYLAAACRVAALRAAFAADGPAFATAATSLLLTRWCASGSAAAADAYGALARLLQPCGPAAAAAPAQALVALWRNETDARVARSLPLCTPVRLLPPYGQLDAGCTPQEAVSHLADELTRATAANRASLDSDECAAAAAAATHLTVLLRTLLAHLPLLPGGANAVEAAIKKGCCLANG